MKQISRAAKKVNRRFVKTFRIYELVEEPVFIIGCGRSGTTILGEMLGTHPDIVYLNEPRYIWEKEPRTDIWSEDAVSRGGCLRLTAQDYSSSTCEKIKVELSIELALHKGSLLVEKLPANSFRIDYIKSLFPNAKFIHMLRNGIEVAHSIENRYELTKLWYGKDDYKWHLLSDYAVSRNKKELVLLAQNNIFLRGLLEWYLSVSTVLEDLEKIPPESCLELRYEDLLSNPEKMCKVVETFLQLPHSQEMKNFASKSIKRRSPKASDYKLNSEIEAIVGDLLFHLGYLESVQEPIQANPKKAYE